MKKIIMFLLVTALVTSCQKSSLDDSAQDDTMLKKTAKVEKVNMRHNGHIISVNSNAMDAHFAHGDQLIVTSADLASDISAVIAAPSKWFFYNDLSLNTPEGDGPEGIDNSLGSFVEGPDVAPFGNGSVQISVEGKKRRNLATYQFSGTPLADITVLAFSTYNPSAGNGGPANRTGYLNFNVDFDGSDSWQSRLIFTPPAGTVIPDTWQEWDCIDGGNAVWHWSGFANGPDGTSGKKAGDKADDNRWPDGNTTTNRTWADLLTTFDGIRVRVTDSWFGIRVGSPYSNGYTENIDAIKFNEKTFDFEN